MIVLLLPPGSYFWQATAKLVGNRLLICEVTFWCLWDSLLSDLNTLAFLEKRSQCLAFYKLNRLNLFVCFLVEEVQLTKNIWECQDFTGADENRNRSSSQAEKSEVLDRDILNCAVLRPSPTASPSPGSKAWI